MHFALPLIVPLTVLALASPRPPPPPPEPSAWKVHHLEGTACRLESDKATLNDGYQQSAAQLLVTPTEVKVVSESTFDWKAGELLIEVDRNEPVKADGLSGDKTVMFKNSASNLIAQFKAGLKARVQLRFWPTWPETGNHSATVSLIGFTKAWEEMQESCR
jgi:hypothetical protein